MAFTFKPAIYRASLYELPRPVPRIVWQDAWDYGQWKVPLKDGDELVGHSAAGVDITVEGQIGLQAGAAKLTEQAMFQELEALRAQLDVNHDTEKYEFFLYHDAGSATYRKFKKCSTVRFEADLSDVHLFTYSVLIHAEDPVLYATAPGV